MESVFEKTIFEYIVGANLVADDFQGIFDSVNALDQDQLFDFLLLFSNMASKDFVKICPCGSVKVVRSLRKHGKSLRCSECGKYHCLFKEPPFKGSALTLNQMVGIILMHSQKQNKYGRISHASQILGISYKTAWGYFKYLDSVQYGNHRWYRSTLESNFSNDTDWAN